MGGHIGAGAARQAASNFFFHAVLPAWLVHPGQQAYELAESTRSWSVMTQSASAVHAVSSGGRARGAPGLAAEAEGAGGALAEGAGGEDGATDEAVATADGAGSSEAGAGTFLSQARSPTKPTTTVIRCIGRMYTYPGGSMGTKPPERASKVS
jgi:hypothetical protein